MVINKSDVGWRYSRSLFNSKPVFSFLFVVKELNRTTAISRHVCELKLRADADGGSVAQYVAVLIIDDLNNGKPVLRTSHRGRNPEAYELNLPAGLLDRRKLEARAKAEVRSEISLVLLLA